MEHHLDLKSFCVKSLSMVENVTLHVFLFAE